MKIVTAEQMREVDRRAIEERGIPGRVLMENAGKAVADLVRRALVEPSGATAIVFSGKGNNGGDGFVVARHLARWGMKARITLVGRAADLSGDAAYHLKAAREAGVPVEEVTEALSSWPGREALATAAEKADVLIDALLGTGVRGEVTGTIGELIALIVASRVRSRRTGRSRGIVIAVDIPSGIDSDTGAVLGRAIVADHTVTMGLPKLGLVVGEGIAHSGQLTVADIGFPPEVIAQAEAEAELIEREWADSVLAPRRRDAHKGDFGRVAIIAGSVGMTGAAALCSAAALRMGAGLVTLGVPASLNDIMEVKLTEVMTRPLPETAARTLSLQARDLALRLAEEADVVVMGPGLGRNEETAALVRELVAAIPRPLVLDADGLNALAGDPSPLKARGAPTVCTPHPGEMGRLLGMSAAEVQRDRLNVARRAASDLGCVMVLKGAGTIIADLEGGLSSPQAAHRPPRRGDGAIEGGLSSPPRRGDARVNLTGNPGMASAGTGDVLTGMIGGLLAAGAPAWRAGSPARRRRTARHAVFDAAAAAVFFHGAAGDIAAREKTEQCLVAGDLLDALPAALKRPQ